MLDYVKDLDPESAPKIPDNWRYIDGSQSSNKKQVFVLPVDSSITVEQMMHNKVPFKSVADGI